MRFAGGRNLGGGGLVGVGKGGEGGRMGEMGGVLTGVGEVGGCAHGWSCNLGWAGRVALQWRGVWSKFFSRPGLGMDRGVRGVRSRVRRDMGCGGLVIWASVIYTVCSG